MKGNWLDILVLCLYMAGMFAVTFVTRKKSRTLNDFLLAGKGMSGIMTAFAYGTTYFSAVIFIGYAGKNGYTFGLAALWIGIGNAIIGSWLAWAVLAKRTRRLTHYSKARTMPEMIEYRYQSKHLKLVCAIIIFIFLVPYAASVYQGLAYLFELIFNIPFFVIVLIMATLTALYLFFGGYFATVLTDFIQGIIMIVGVVVMIAFVLNYEKVGGAIEGFSKLFADDLGFFPAFIKDGKPHGYTLMMLVLLTSFGTWGLPQIIHKFHTVKSEKAIKQATWISSGFALIIGIGAYLVGCFARYALDNVGGMLATPGGEDMIIPNLLVAALPAGLLGLIVVLILSASMSTLSSLTLASSSSVAVDLYKGYINKNASDKKVNILMRLLCVGFILISVVIAITKPSSIINLMSLSWGTLAGCFLAPYLYGLYNKKATKAGAYSAIISSLVLTAVLYTVSLILGHYKIAAAAYLSPPAIGVFAMALSMIVMPIVSALTRKMQPEFVDRLFGVMKINEDLNADSQDVKGSLNADSQDSQYVKEGVGEANSSIANDRASEVVGEGLAVSADNSEQ